MKNKIKLMIDSGAFSAWRKNETIGVEDYTAFIMTHKHSIDSYIALDVIPGVVGSIGTPKSIEESAKKTDTHLQYMRKRGLDPIAVYHMGERRYWLEKLVKEGAKYIGLGGLARVPEEMRRPWLDSVFEFFCGEGGYPDFKIHGFGVTSIETVHRYPWYSVDSVSWRMHSAYGWAIVPERSLLNDPGPMQWEENPQWGYDYTRTPLQIYLSKGSESGKNHQSARTTQHIDKMSGSMRQYVQDYLKDQGFDYETVRINSTARTRLSLRFYKLSAEAYRYKPFTRRCPGIFNLLGDGERRLAGTSTPPKKLKMIYGASPSRHLLRSLRSEDIRRILLSYVYFKGRKSPLSFEDFARTGDIGNHEESKTEFVQRGCFRGV